MNKDLIIAFLLVLLSHKFLLNLIESRPKVEKMDNVPGESGNMKDELMQFIMNLQGSASGTSGVTEVSSANTMAKASFGSESTDLSKHFAMKASDAIAKLPSTAKSTETHNPVDSAPVPIDNAPTPMSGSDFLLLKRSTDDSVMNGGSFFGNVVPFSNDSPFAGL